METQVETTVDTGKVITSTIADTFHSIGEWLFGSLSLGKVIAAAVVLLVCLLSARLILTAVRRGTKRSQLDATLQLFLMRLLKAFLLTLSVMIAASTLGVNVTSLVAVLGVASLAVSLALQGTLSNLVGGVMLLTAKPFALGDFIECGSISGTVKEIGLFYTDIATYDNKQIHIPNSTVSSSVIINYTAAPKRIVEIIVSASYDSDMYAVKEALRDAAGTAPGLLPEEPIVAVVNNYRANDIEYMLRFWVASQVYFDAKFAATEQIKVLFDERGIRMSYPHLNVHLDH